MVIIPCHQNYRGNVVFHTYRMRALCVTYLSPLQFN